MRTEREYKGYLLVKSMYNSEVRWFVLNKDSREQLNKYAMSTMRECKEYVDDVLNSNDIL